MYINGLGWAGSKHGNEELLSYSLTADRNEVDLVDDQTYSGDELVLERHSMLGEALELSSVVTLDEAGITEQVRLRVLREIDLEVIYGMLGSRSNVLKECASFTEDGQVAHEATMSNTDDSVHFKQSPAVAQYNPVAGVGTVSEYLLSENLKHSLFLLDRKYDNKVYLRLTGAEGIETAGSELWISRRTSFFDAEPSEWLSVAGDIVAGRQPPVEIGDANLDGVVDELDLEVLRAHYNADWGMSSRASWQGGDLNQDGRSDFADFVILSNNCGAIAPPEPLAEPIPEPSSLLLLALGPALAYGRSRSLLR